VWLREAHAWRGLHSSPGRTKFRFSADSRVYRRAIFAAVPPVFLPPCERGWSGQHARQKLRVPSLPLSRGAFSLASMASARDDENASLRHRNPLNCLPEHSLYICCGKRRKANLLGECFQFRTPQRRDYELRRKIMGGTLPKNPPG